MIAAELPPGQIGDITKYQDYANEGKVWLLKRMQSILSNDFIEYNARPYQRYSIIALYNLWDFSPDPQLKTMAGMVLEYAELKFAIAGNQSRRSVPFRRRQEVTDSVTSITDSAGGADFQVSQMLLLTGQLQQLMPPPLAPGGLVQNLNQGQTPLVQVSRDSVSEMIYLATSGYRPDPQIVELAVRKVNPYYQRLSHSGGVEIYSGARGYVISAGGIETAAAYSVTVDGVSLDQQVDHGAGVPTALLLAAGTGNTDRLDFIRIEGLRLDHGSSGNTDFPDWHNVSYQHNTCVWKGFACGVNVVIPKRIVSDACTADVRPGANGGEWQFFDTTRWDLGTNSGCDKTAPKVYVAVYQRPCPGGDQSCQVNQGFFEAVDNPVDDFATFQTSVLTQNPKPFDDASASSGTYHSNSGHAIGFDSEAHQKGVSNWGIGSIDGAPEANLGKWPPAEGDIINASGDGHIVITFPQTGNKIQYDFSNWALPVRTP